MLAGLRHRAVRCGDHENRAVHLSGAGDHVLDIIGVAWAVDVSIVAVSRLILDVSRVDRDPTLFFLRRVIDLIVGASLRPAFFCQTVVMAAVNVVLPWST